MAHLTSDTTRFTAVYACDWCDCQSWYVASDQQRRCSNCLRIVVEDERDKQEDDTD